MATHPRLELDLPYETIHVRLLDEAVDAWRPVKAYRVDTNTFVVSRKQPYEPDIEEWEFEPGAIVLAAEIVGAKGVFFAAVGRRKYYRIDESNKLRWCYPDAQGQGDRF